MEKLTKILQRRFKDKRYTDRELDHILHQIAKQVEDNESGIKTINAVQPLSWRRHRGLYFMSDRTALPTPFGTSEMYDDMRLGADTGWSVGPGDLGWNVSVGIGDTGEDWEDYVHVQVTGMYATAPLIYRARVEPGSPQTKVTIELSNPGDGSPVAAGVPIGFFLSIDYFGIEMQSG